MTIILITIEDLDNPSPAGNVAINIKHLARPGEPEDSPATQLAGFVQQAVEKYFQTQATKVAKDNVQHGKQPCWH